jgi:5,10-methylene-tetrahydrofolate dehydrogenase/methenyl tetrahydrofolate cyclohydrolase
MWWPCSRGLSRGAALQRSSPWRAPVRHLASASIIDGKAIAAEIRAAVKVDADGLAAAGACPPGLAVVLVGARSDSATYVNMKKKAAAEAGFHSVTKELPVDVEQAELMRTVQQLNDDPAVDGILVQLPLPGHLDQAAVLESIVVEKDVDGFHPQNMGSMARYGEEMRRSKSGPFDVMKLPINAPCTPLGCIELIKRAGGSLEGQHIVVLGKQAFPVDTPSKLAVYP